MTSSKIDGISAETVEAASRLIQNACKFMGINLATRHGTHDENAWQLARQAIDALPEVVLRKDVRDETYYAWLIEQRDNNGKPTWLCNPYFPEFTDNAWDALHFGRKSDAEAYADSETYTLYISEHAFPSAKFTSKEARHVEE